MCAKVCLVLTSNTIYFIAVYLFVYVYLTFGGSRSTPKRCF